ncbi:MAG: AAA family ATPase [archaeon]
MSGSLFPITKEALEKYDADVDSKMNSIRVDRQTRSSLPDLLKGLKIDKDWTETDDALRKGFALYYELYDQLQRRIVQEKIGDEVPDADKRNFMGAYATFGATSFIENRLGKIIQGEPMEAPWKKESLGIDFSQPQNDVLSTTLATYYGVTNIRKTKGIVTNGQDLAQSSMGYFKVLREKALDLKPTLNKRLVDLVSSADFRIMDEFTLSGFESRVEEKAASKSEFTLVQPHEVVGNVLAKKEMFRDMDRLALYDPILKKNPISEVGGLSWSVIYVGLPGTGKSTLFLAGWTRAKLRCEQTAEFWKSKNAKPLYLHRVMIDPKVKDKMYGGTAAKMAAADEETGDPTRINIGVIDDIDLLMEGDRDGGNGGADKDILNGLMQIMGGTDLSKRKRGCTQWWSATNAPTSIDPALLQRYGAQYQVDGPQEWYDYADILQNKLGGWLKPGMKIIDVPLGDGYKPFEMRKGQTGFENVSKEDEQFIDESLSRFKGGIKTFKEIGELCVYYKQRNPRFTGRPIDSVSDAIKKRINDYDVRESWFENPDEFFFKPFEERVGILRECSKKVSAEDIAREIIRYARNQEIYATEKFRTDVAKELNYNKVRMEAMRQFGEQKK